MIGFLTAQTPTSTVGWMLFLAERYAASFWQGTWITLYVAVVGTIVGFVMGFLLGIIQDIRMSREDNIVKKCVVKSLKAVCSAYVELFRDTPMIVQAMVIYYGLRQANVEIGVMAAAVLVTLLNTGAYMAETVRAGINSIALGQREGGLALGMSPMKVMFAVVLPQAFKNIIPEMANMFLTNLKMTSVLNVIGLSELFMTAKTVAGNYYKYFESYLIIAAIYFVLCFLFNKLFLYLEKKMALKKDYVLAVEFMDNQ